MHNSVVSTGGPRGGGQDGESTEVEDGNGGVKW